MRRTSILWLGAVAVALTAGPATAQTTLIGPDQIVRLVNAELQDATLRLHSQGAWSARNTSFFHNDSRLRLLDRTVPIDLVEVRIEPKSRFGIYYYFNANDVRADSIRLSHEGGQYALNLFFELADPEIKGMCRWRRANRDFTQCRPTGNDRPAPDVDFRHFSIRVPIDPVIEGLGFTIPPVDCEEIEVRLEAELGGVLGLGDNNLPERIAGRKLRGEIRKALCNLLGSDPQFRSSMGERTGLRLANLPELAGKAGVRPVKFTSGGALEMRSQPSVLDASVGFTPAGGGCPQTVNARVAVATDRARIVRVRFEDGERTGPWIPIRSEPVSLGGGGGGFAAVEERPIGWKLGEGMHRIRLHVEGAESTKWSRVPVTCASRVQARAKAAVEPTSGPRKAGQCPLHVHFTGTITIEAPGRYTYFFRGHDGSRTSPKPLVANAPGTTEVFWNRRVPAGQTSPGPPPRTIGGWTQLVILPEAGRRGPQTIQSERAPFQVVCTNGVGGRPSRGEGR